MQFRYRGTSQLERIPDIDESIIYVVIQDSKIYTFITLLHELIHWGIFKFFHDSQKLHDLLDKLDKT